MSDEMRWELPPNWAWARAIGFADVVGGGTPKNAKNSENYASEGIPWVTPADLSGYSGTYIERGARDLSVKGFHSCSARMLPKGSVLMSSRAPVGYCVISANEISTNQGFKSFVPRSDEIVPEFLRYYLIGSKQYLESEASGTTFLELSGGRTEQLIFPIAPAAEQRRIVSKIDELFSRIEEGERALERVQKLVERYRQSVLKAAVTGELTREWREKRKGTLESGEALLARILKARREAWEKSELGKMKTKGQKPANDDWKRKYKEPVPPDTTDLPDLLDGWVWASLDQVSVRVTDGTHQPPPFAPQGVPFLTIQHLSPGCIHWDEIEKWVSHNTFLEYTKSMRPMSGDVLYSAVGSYGIAVAVKTPKDFMFQRHIAHIRPIGEYLKATFLEVVLNSPLSMNRANRVARGVAQKTVTLGDLREFPIPVTTPPEQQAILDQLAKAESSIAELTNEMRLQQTSASLRQAILKTAFAGELIEQSSDDEPASVLLGRIAAERGDSRKKTAPRRRKREKVTA